MAERNENFSVFVSKTLNAVGYKWQMVQLRRDFAIQAEHIGNGGLLSNTGLILTTAGSKREGVATPLGGDNDQMIVFNEVICTEDVQMFEKWSHLTILEMNLNESPPGYTLLSPTKHGGRYCQNMLTNEIAQQLLQVLVDSVCVSDGNESHMSSDIFINTMTKMLKNGIDVHKNYLFPDSIHAGMHSLQARAGPSIQTITKNDYIKADHDNVYAFPCHCPSVFERFRNRRRKHGWPPQHILQELSQLEAHVVPVGHKRSARHFLEWRICFTKAEIRLIECLTEPQIHVFILLKMFAKDVLKDVWDTMTSYIMKNLILWVAELMPTHMFRPDTIVDRFLDCLFFLKLCLKVGKLPNYMISERNLFSHDQFIVKRPKLLSVIEDCLGEKGSCLFRSSRLNEAMVRMYRTPESTVQHGLDRDITEKAVLSYMTRLLPGLNLESSAQDIFQLVLSGYASEVIQLFYERFTLDEIVHDPMATIHRMLEMTFSHLR